MDNTLSHKSLENKLARIEIENLLLQMENQDMKKWNNELQSQLKHVSYSFSKVLKENRMLERTLSLIEDAVAPQLDITMVKVKELLTSGISEIRSERFTKDVTIQTENTEMDDKEHAIEFARPEAVRPTPLSKFF